MNQSIKNLLLAAALLLGAVGFAAAEPDKGYKVLDPALPTSSNKIEVLEFFYYGCSHCFDLHPPLSAWEKTMPQDVELILVPTIFRESWEVMARTFYALESMGQLQKLHDPLFRAMHVDKITLNDEAQIGDFVAKNGVDRTKFSAAYNSFSMRSKVERAKQMIRIYGISGTPTIVVDGKYLITGLRTADTMRVLNEVIVMARKARSAKPKRN